MESSGPPEGRPLAGLQEAATATLVPRDTNVTESSKHRSRPPGRRPGRKRTKRTQSIKKDLALAIELDAIVETHHLRSRHQQETIKFGHPMQSPQEDS
jgi:hypothetical protein